MSRQKWLVVIFLALSVIGLLDASYLTAKDLMHAQVTCSIFSGCETVLTSKYAHVGSIPTASFGIAYYLALAILSGLYLQLGKKGLLDLMLLLASVGLVVSIGLVYLQLFVIKSICIYCFTSALDSLMLFLVAVFGMRGAALENQKPEL